MARVKTKFTTVFFSVHLTDGSKHPTWNCYSATEDFLGFIEWGSDTKEYVLTHITFESTPFGEKRLKEIAQFIRILMKIGTGAMLQKG